MDFSASVEYVRMIMNYALQFDIDPDQIYQKVGFDSSILQKPGARIPADQFVAIWEAMEERTQNQNLGLHIGEKVSIFPGNILFILMLNASTIKAALDKLVQYFNILIDFSSPYISTKKNLTEMIIRFHTTELEVTRHAYEGLLAAYASALQLISQYQIQFEGAYFAHPRPKDISEHQRIFNAPLFFGQAENKLVFKKDFLSMPVPLSNTNILESLEVLARMLQDKINTYRPWSEEVSQIILDMLKNEKTEIEPIARKLAISPRILQNRLKKEGVTYQKLLDDIRKEQAIYFLKKENIPISEITFLLGYSDQSAFNRAFKRWVGSTPGQYRSQFK